MSDGIQDVPFQAVQVDALVSLRCPTKDPSIRPRSPERGERVEMRTKCRMS